MEQNQLMEIDESKDLNYVALKPQERTIVDNYMKSIDITNNTSLMKFGAESQNKIAGFSENILKSIIVIIIVLHIRERLIS